MTKKMKPITISRSSLTMNSIWKARGRRPTIRRTCKVYIPRDLSTLDMLRLPATYEEDPFIIRKLKSFTKHKLHHLILVIVITCYLYLGALLFQYLEDHYSPERPYNLSVQRESLIRHIFNSSQSMLQYESQWLTMTRNSILLHESKILAAAKQGYEGDQMKPEHTGWSIETAVIFCFAVISTVGYGNISPSTDVTRAVTIIYAVIGIPLMILVLADLGKLFTKAIKFLFRYYRRFYTTGSCKTNATAITSEKKPLQYMTVSWRTLSHEQNSSEDNATPSHQQRRPSSSFYFQKNQVTTLTLHNDDLYKNLDFLNPDEKNHKHVEVEDDFTLPVSLAISLVLVYMLIGGFIFAVWEEWTFFEAFYFVFVSTTTVGLGDYAPTHQRYMMGAFVYLVFGLTLSSMCINVVREKLSAMFQKTKVTIGNNKVLDVHTLLKDEDHRSRAVKPSVSNDTLPTKCKGVKMTIHKNSCFPGETKPKTDLPCSSRKLSSLSEDESSIDLSKRDILLKVPLQNRFTFYDSPYGTIQSEDTTSTMPDIQENLFSIGCSK